MHSYAFAFSLLTRVTLGKSRGLADTPACHPEHSEGSGTTGHEMLRFAQHDNAMVSMTGWTDCHTMHPYPIDQACSQCCARSTARFQPA